MRQLPVYIICILVSGCGLLKNQDVGIGQNGTIAAHNNLDRASAIALFQGQRSQQCLSDSSDALEYAAKIETAKAQSVLNNGQLTDLAVIAREFRLSLEAATLSNENIVAHYQNKQIRYPTQVEMIHAVSRYCNETNLYDRDIARSASRSEAMSNISRSLFSFLGKGVTAYAAYKAIDSIKPDNTTNAPNTAIGDNNGVSEPVVVDPVIVEVPAPVAPTPAPVTP